MAPNSVADRLKAARAATLASTPSPIASTPLPIATSSPTTQPVRLTVIAVDELVSLEQRFRCVPYAAIIRSGECVRRQVDHGGRVQIGGPRGTTAKVWKPGMSKMRTRPVNHGRCGDCELGRHVIAQLEGATR